MSRQKPINMTRVQKHALARLIGTEATKQAVAYRKGVLEYADIDGRTFVWGASEQTWLLMVKDSQNA